MYKKETRKIYLNINAIKTHYTVKSFDFVVTQFSWN